MDVWICTDGSERSIVTSLLNRFTSPRPNPPGAFGLAEKPISFLYVVWPSTVSCRVIGLTAKRWRLYVKFLKYKPGWKQFYDGLFFYLCR
jgi:hypothetical protein